MALGSHFEQQNHQQTALNCGKGAIKQTMKRTLVYCIWTLKQESRTSLCPTPGDAKFSRLCECPPMITKAPHEWIWALQINFSKSINLKIQNPHLMRIDPTSYKKVCLKNQLRGNVVYRPSKCNLFFFFLKQW